MKQHLSLDIYYATEHAQVRMKKLGITYQTAVPQSLGDCWWFFNCDNVPDPLPEDLKPLTRRPHDYIGFGLSKQMADEIVANEGGAQ